MKNGRLNESEIKRVGKAWTILEDLQRKLPRCAPHQAAPDERLTLDLLLRARNAAGELLAWQDHCFYQQICSNNPSPHHPVAQTPTPRP